MHPRQAEFSIYKTIISQIEIFLQSLTDIPDEVLRSLSSVDKMLTVIIVRVIALCTLEPNMDCNKTCKMVDPIERDKMLKIGH